MTQASDGAPLRASGITEDGVPFVVMRGPRGLVARYDMNGNVLPDPAIPYRPPPPSSAELAEYETGVPAHIVQAGLRVLDDATGGEGLLWDDEDARIVARIYLAMRRIYAALE